MDKKQVLYIHGGQAFSEYKEFLNYLKTTAIRDPLGHAPQRWRDVLGEGLGEEYEVFLPSMPNKQNAKYEEWKIWFERHVDFLRDGVVLIGHSQGGYFLAKYLSENTMPVRVRALYLVAAPIGPDNFGGEDGGDFSFDAALLPEGLKDIGDVFIVHSKDDVVVPFSHAGRYLELLPDVTPMLFEDRGHFLQESFPELVKSIQEL